MNSEKWLKTITDFANNTDFMIRWYGGHCFEPYYFQRHHILGKQVKRKINLVSEHVGEYVVIPVPFELHDVSSNNRLNVTHCKNSFEGVIGRQKDIFKDMVNCMRSNDYEVPFNNEVVECV